MIDPQQKRGLLDSCVLGVLCRGESHGYQIVKDLLSCIDISESTLSILRRLETDGCLTVRSVEHNGRLRMGYK
ncbi:MAG: PadR family transcriptional regulator [Oscillospiraceae bacterium]